MKSSFDALGINLESRNGAFAKDIEILSLSLNIHVS